MTHIVYKQKSMIISNEITLNELIFTVKPNKLREFIQFLKTDTVCLFNQLMLISGVDYPERKERFDVVYNLLSMKHNQRIRVKVSTNEEVKTISDLYLAAGWYEREAFDMFGIKFNGNKDLRRILTDYDFEGHPLRKDFPLLGFEEIHYSEEKRKIVKTEVKLPQKYRDFDFVSTWDGDRSK